MTSLSEKTINNSLTRANSAEIANFVMPSKTENENITVLSSGSEYEAPAAGWFCGECRSSSAGHECSVYTTSASVGMTSYATVGSQYQISYCPCQKGDKVKFVYVESTPQLRFVYSEGAK